MRILKSAPVFIAAMLVLASIAQAQETKVGSLVIAQPWTRATPGGARVAGGYLTITNNGTTPDRLIGGSTEIGTGFEIHEMRMDKDVASMREIPGGLEIKPGTTVKFSPSGYHLMFTHLKRPLKVGEMVHGELKFEKAGSVAIEYRVEGVGVQKPMQGMH